jgi:hypothetical protein
MVLNIALNKIYVFTTVLSVAVCCSIFVLVLPTFDSERPSVSLHVSFAVFASPQVLAIMRNNDRTCIAVGVLAGGCPWEGFCVELI